MANNNSIYKNRRFLILVLLTVMVAVFHYYYFDLGKNVVYYSAILSVIVLFFLWERFYSSEIVVKRTGDYINKLWSGSLSKNSTKMGARMRVNKLAHTIELMGNKIHETEALVKNLGSTDNLQLTELSPNDILGKALLDVNRKLFHKNQQESQRKWVVEGLAKFGEQLRDDDEDLDHYSFKLISEIVKYTESVQGGLYVHEQVGDREFLKLQGAYAFDKNRLNRDVIEKGQGQLGQCMIEQKIVQLDDVPADYLMLESGLGESVPSYVIIVPLLFEGDFFGVIELASFSKYEDYKVEFLSGLSESIASAIRNIKITNNTNKLLEDARNLTRELQLKEEDTRQNMEELAATQEEMQRHQAQLNSLFNGIDQTLALMEVDADKKVSKLNDICLSLLNNKSDVVGKLTFDELLGVENNPDEIWNTLRNKESVSGEYKISIDKREVWIDASFTPILGQNENFQKVLMLAKDITEEKALELENKKRDAELHSHINAINKTIASCEYNMSGYLENANDIFLGITGYTLDEIKGKHHFDLIPEADRDKPQTALMWGGIKDGKFFSGEFKLMSKQGKELWLNGTYNPILALDGTPYKVMMFAQFTTTEKERNIQLTGSVNALKNTHPILEISDQRVFKSANKLFFEKFGYSRKELRGKLFEEIVRDPSPEMLIEKLVKVSENNFVDEYLTFYFPDKSKKKYRVTFTPIFNLEEILDKIVIVIISDY